MTKIRDMSKLEAAALKMGITGEELRAFLPLMLEVQDEINKEKIRNLKKVTEKAKGGDIEKQMEMFQDGGLKDEGNTVDPVSGNDVPPGATQEEVRDDIPAQLSEGEFVFPADVVRYIGLEKLMRMRQEAKMGLKMMEEMGQMGNADEATIPDDIPFSVIDINIAEDDEDEEVEKRAEGGVIEAANGFAGTTTTTNPLQQRQPNVAGAQTGIKTPYVAPTIPTATAAPIGGFKYKSPIDTTKKATYTGLFGGEELTQGPDEYRTYVNDAGAEIQIPFKNGKILTGFSVPEGFKAKTDSPLAPKIQTARTKTTKVQDEGGSDSDDELSTLGGARTTINDVEYAVQYNFNGTVSLANVNDFKTTGKVNFNQLTDKASDLIKQQTLGQIAQLAYSPRSRLAVELARKAGVTIPGSNKIQGLIDRSVTATRDLDRLGLDEIFDMGQRQLDKEFKDRSREDRKDGPQVEGLKEKDLRKIQAGLQFGAGKNINKGLSKDFIENLDIAEAARKGRDALGGGEGIGTSTGEGSTSFGEPSGQTSFSTSSEAEEAGYGGTGFGSGLSTAVGGFIPKKKKPKKMKRGGLASKK